MSPEGFSARRLTSEQRRLALWVLRYPLPKMTQAQATAASDRAHRWHLANPAPVRAGSRDRETPE